MEDILSQLLSSELLSEEARTEISTKWKSEVEKYKDTLKEAVTLEVRSEISEQWAQERDELVEQLDTLVSTTLTAEIAELKEGFESFRDLEAEYAAQIVEQKHTLTARLDEEINDLVERLDTFLEARIKTEIHDLKEDLEVVKQNHFGRKIFEAFNTEFGSSFVDEASIAAQLNSTKQSLAESKKQLKSLSESNDKLIRESKLEKILSPLSGRKREQMAFVLQNVETNRLDEAYSQFIGRVLREDSSEKIVESKTAIVTGNESTETATSQTPTKDNHAHLRKLAGI